MNIRPLYDRVIVKRLEAEVKTKSGLYIPKPQREAYSGASCCCGQRKANRRRHSSRFGSKGERPGSFASIADEIKLDGEGIILREDEILAIIDL